MRFQDKVAIVTGGNSGMGKEVATRFVAEGGSIVVNGRGAAKTEAAARQIDLRANVPSSMSAMLPFRRPATPS
jgi:NAD(P)-dependent dehydrogenase (short-subunit alcohol dehydrogenase family)